VKLPVTTTQWRLKIANKGALSDVQRTLGGSPQFTGAWYGDPSFAANLLANDRWGGDFTSTPAQVIASSALNADGSDWWSPWVTDPTKQFTAGRLHALSYGHNSPGASRYWDPVAALTVNAAGASAGAGAVSMASLGAPGTASALDIRLEYEFVTTGGPGGVRHLVTIGDSITRGFVQSASDIWAHESWPGQVGLRDGIAVTNIGVGTSQAGVGASGDLIGWSGGTGTEWRWTRADLTTTPPDMAIIKLGFNDVLANDGRTAATIQGNIKTVIDRVRALGIKRVYLATLIPGNNVNEAMRGTINTWIGSVPYGVDGVFDFNREVGLQATPQTMDSALTNGFPHPNARGYSRMADVVRFGRDV
jgi:lysophospholipase L1-like esterase